MARIGAGTILVVHALITGAIWIPPQRELAGFGPQASLLFAGSSTEAAMSGFVQGHPFVAFRPVTVRAAEHTENTR